jgi:hypothetical protein
MKFVFFNSYHNANNGLELCQKLNGKYHICPKLWLGNQQDIYNDIAHADMIIIWNSLEPCTHWIKDICHQLNKKYLYLEYGFVPQKDMFHLDTHGIIKQSSLNSNLDWLTESMSIESEVYINEFFKNKHWSNKGSEYILCPLQLPWDTSIYLCSKYKNMNEFLYDIINMYPNEKIVVTPHPKLRKSDTLSTIKSYQLSTDITNHITLDNKNSTMFLAQRAKEVVGITSTVLYETIALGKKTIALGECPIRQHNGDRKVVLAAIQRQFRCNDVSKFLSIMEKL